MDFKVRFVWVVFICFILNRSIIYAQVTEDNIISQIIESIAENIPEDQDYSEIAERLYFYRKNPLDINTASREQLQELVFLSQIQINTILLHREVNGLFLDVLELQALPGFEIENIRRLLYFVTFKDSNILADITSRKILDGGNHDIMIRLGGLGSFEAEPDYPGSGFKILTRYRYNYSHKIAALLNMEKDAGEQFFSGNKGFDFYSGSVSMLSKGTIRRLVLGDYALQFGQGLCMWSGLGFGKGGGLIGIAKQDIGIRPYSSINESSFLRGISASLGYKRFLLIPFFSYKKVDAALSEEQEIKSLLVSGLHRTETELTNKNSASQLIYGANFQYKNNDLTIGFTGYNTRFNLPFVVGKLPYQRYDFSGNSLTNLGFNFSYTLKNTYFFGETAHSLSSGFAYINGLLSSLSKELSVVLLHRNYAVNYHSFFSQSIAESTEAMNEKGFYSGFTMKFDSKWDLFTYSDFFRFPWLKFGVDAPSKGYELFIQLNYTPGKRFKVNARYKQQLKEENSEEGNTLTGLETTNRQNYRLEIAYKINNTFTFRNRAEITCYKKHPFEQEFGFLNYQDIIFDPLNSKISGNIRFAIFDMESFNSRIYAYENDVLYSYSVPAYQGRGVKYYLNVRYSATRNLDLWFRYAGISYSDQSSFDKNSGKARGSDIRFQLRYRF